MTNDLQPRYSFKRGCNILVTFLKLAHLTDIDTIA